MTSEVAILTATAASIGFVHTIIGPDHYLPFVMMGRVQQWSIRKTGLITALCGLGHILSSVVIGFIGVALGKAIGQLQWIEGQRASIAAWGLTVFGIVYLVWGIRAAIKNRTHTHWHAHEEGTVHDHKHIHKGQHAHVHTETTKQSITPWILFTIFVFGPCEALIPMLMLPAIAVSLLTLLWVTVVFAVVTLATMVSAVVLMSMGANLLPMGRLERYGHALAGGIICACGLAMLYLEPLFSAL